MAGKYYPTTEKDELEHEQYEDLVYRVGEREAFRITKGYSEEDMEELDRLAQLDMEEQAREQKKADQYKATENTYHTGIGINSIKNHVKVDEKNRLITKYKNGKITYQKY